MFTFFGVAAALYFMTIWQRYRVMTAEFRLIKNVWSASLHYHCQSAGFVQNRLFVLKEA